MEREHLLAVFHALLGAYGPQGWWPGETPFEIMVGAVLTQNTSWNNVEKGLAALTARIPLTPEAILGLPQERLTSCIRPVGYFNVKAQRLRAFCIGYRDAGELEGLSPLETGELRRRLLAIHGVGPETADDMLLYAFARPVFVVDAYTRRIFSRLGELVGTDAYEGIRQSFETALGPDASLYNEYHALIVRHGKNVCRTKPRCIECCLRSLCRVGSG